MLKYFYVDSEGVVECVSSRPLWLPTHFELMLECEEEKITEFIDSSEFIEEFLRAMRNSALQQTLWISERHQTQPEGAKTLTEEQYQAYQQYWQQLRDLPEIAVIENYTRFTVGQLLPPIPQLF